MVASNFGVVYSKPMIGGLPRFLHTLLIKKEPRTIYLCVGEGVYLTRIKDEWSEVRYYAKTKLYEEPHHSIADAAEAWGVSPSEATSKFRSYLTLPDKTQMWEKMIGGNGWRYESCEDMEDWWEQRMTSPITVAHIRHGFLGWGGSEDNTFYWSDRNESCETTAFVSTPFVKEPG
jgi:hypothetical protein